ncbi:glycosyltransferase family 4 protein [Actinomyces israelii]|uniref:Glycosyltransferase family 4 protein n=1 Tax=Actinomyces israelii TaxID=1659 RepID=A0ABT4I6Y2_9ACTO|nr:glycosyltransferase family 4 protein [Actinomyces israelii]MCZ0857485.1 glycosyltransferase family 4 protein [Actinomyces israelii]
MDPEADRRPRAAGRRQRVLEACGSAAGGVRAHLGDCARLLARAGHDVIVEAPDAALEGLDLGGARGEGLEIGPGPGPGDPAVVARLRRLGRRADVVHAHGLRAGALAALALGRRRPGRTRLVVTLHNLTVGGRLTRAVGERLERLVAARADLVLAVSPDLAERAAARGAARVEIAVIPAPPRTPTGAAPHAPSAEPAWRGPGRRLLTVARLAPQKGIGLLLDAAAVLQSRVDGGELPAFVWALAGEGPAARAARERAAAEELPVRVLGGREDVPVLLAEADVVVQTSLWEGQPLAIQEALRAGAAIVATDVGGTALTARGGAVLVAPDAQALADAVAALLADDAAREAARGRARLAAGGLPTADDLADQLAGHVLEQE